jgi:hypothetical protein
LLSLKKDAKRTKTSELELSEQGISERDLQGMRDIKKSVKQEVKEKEQQ